MKKTFTLFFAIIMAFFGAINTYALDRAHQLKIYNWADYIDESLIKEFEQWYEEQTGEPVQIIYETFDINENMLTKIEVGHADYDAVCPSEYIIERMLRNGDLQKIQKDFGNTPNWLGNVSPFAEAKFQEMAPDSNTLVKDYTVGYMWGTTGFLFNPKYVSREQLMSWGAILNPEFENRIYMKDAFRDIYSVIVLYAFRDEIEAGKVTRDELTKVITQERIDSVEAILKAAKNNIAGWEVDFGKEKMTKGEAWLNLSWSGDAAWAISEALEAEEPVVLDYVVPQEGTNVWFDGWVIPIYAKNPKAASYFINFMCKPENAIRNMEEIGYVSVIGTPEILDAMQDPDQYMEPIDVTYLFGNIEGASEAYLNPVMYPDKSIIDRAALMHDSVEQTEAMLEMWNRVKGSNLSMFWICVILVAFLAVAVVVFASMMSKRNALARRKLHKQ
jgi:spermidine/putrescine transport system substrate-binding protein